MSEDTLTISSRSRNLGIGLSTQPSGTGTAIAPPVAPEAVGGLPTIERQLARIQYIVSGGVYHRVRLFVGRRPVIAFDWAGSWCDGERDLGVLLAELRQGRRVRVLLAQGAEHT